MYPNEKKSVERFLDVLSKEYPNYTIEGDVFSIENAEGKKLSFTFYPGELKGVTPNPNYKVSDDPATQTWYKPTWIEFAEVSLNGIDQPNLRRINRGVKGNIRKVVAEAFSG